MNDDMEDELESLVDALPPIPIHIGSEKAAKTEEPPRKPTPAAEG